MSGTSLNALLFLISTVFDIYLFILVMRFFLALAGADYTHPITQFIVKCTNFIVRPLRKFIPDIRNAEVATIALILFLEIIKFFIIICLSFGLPNLLGLILLAIGDTIKLIFEFLSFVLLLQIILHWLQPASEINQVLDQFTSPVMHPIERAIGPKNKKYIWVLWLIAFIVLQLLIIVLASPLLAQGLKIAVG